MFAFPNFPELIPAQFDGEPAVAAVAPKSREKKTLSETQKQKRKLLQQEVKEEITWQEWDISKLGDPSFVQQLFKTCCDEPELQTSVPLRPAFDDARAASSLSPFGCFSLMRSHHLQVRSRLAKRHADRKGAAALSPEAIAELLAEDVEDKDDAGKALQAGDAAAMRCSTPSLDAAVSQIFRFLSETSRLNPVACRAALQVLLGLFKNRQPQDFLHESAVTMEPLESLISQLLASGILSLDDDASAKRLLLGLVLSAAIAKGTADALLKTVFLLFAQPPSLRSPPPALLSRLVALYHPFLKLSSLSAAAPQPDARADAPLSFLPLQYHFLSD